MQMNYFHPKFKTDDIKINTVLNEQNHKIVRMEYPDGVIVVFDLTSEDVHITSNYGFFTDGFNIQPKFDDPNKNFKDVF